LIFQIKEDTVKRHGEHLGTVVSDNLQKILISDLNNLAVSNVFFIVSQLFHLLKNPVLLNSGALS